MSARTGRCAIIRLVSHRVRQSTRTAWSGRHSRSSTPDEIDRLLDRAPFRAPPRPVLRDARRHLGIERLRGRDVHGRQAARQHQSLGMAALAGAGAAEN